MDSKVGVVQVSSLPADVSTANTGIGMNQLPAGHTRLSSKDATMVHMGTAMIQGAPGQFPQNTHMSVKDGFGKKIDIKRD